jgi:hypothetical protein
VDVDRDPLSVVADDPRLRVESHEGDDLLENIDGSFRELGQFTL